MSMQQGANTVSELLKTIERLAKDMEMRCDNSVTEVVITIDKDGFTVTSD